MVMLTKAERLLDRISIGERIREADLSDADNQRLMWFVEQGRLKLENGVYAFVGMSAREEQAARDMSAMYDMWD